MIAVLRAANFVLAVASRGQSRVLFPLSKKNQKKSGIYHCLLINLSDSVRVKGTGVMGPEKSRPGNAKSWARRGREFQGEKKI